MTTKAQELDALNKIRGILGTLDADSWVNTAFKGVCDIAENNIRDDFADSPVERVESLETELEKTRGELERANADAEHYKGEYDALKEAYERMSDKANARRKVLEDLKSNFEYDLTRANAEILENCGEPDSETFKNAVSLRKNALYWNTKIAEVISCTK